jgi:hypothetical protein
LFSATSVDVAIKAVVARVEDASNEPAVEWWIGIITYLLPTPIPVKLVCGCSPEFFGVVLGETINFIVDTSHLVTSYRRWLVS